MGMSEDLGKIASQERELRLPRLDARVAWELGSKIRTMAVERGLTLVVDVRRFGQPLFYAALDGTYAGQSGMGAPQEQRGGALPSQLIQRGNDAEDQRDDLV